MSRRRCALPRRTRFALAALITATGALAVSATSALAAETLKVSVTGAGTVTGGGIDCGNGAESCEVQFAAKSVITLTAKPTERSTFTGWSGCPEAPSPNKCKVVIKAGVQTDLSAEFTPLPQEILTVGNPGTGLGGGLLNAPEPGPEFLGIQCGEEQNGCTAEYNLGTIITLTAEPTERSTFSGWEAGDCKSESGIGNKECKVEMTEAKTVKANFIPIPQDALTVAVEGSGQGSLTASPGGEFTAIECGEGATACEAHYNQGATIILAADRATHSKFVRWVGCPSALSSDEYITSECEVTMSGAKSVSAEFAPIPQHALSAEVTGPGEITSSPAGIACNSTGGTCTEHFDAEGPESTITLFASTPADHHVAWSGCGSATENECSVSMSAARSVKAEFLANMHTLTVTRVGSGEVDQLAPGN